MICQLSMPSRSYVCMSHDLSHYLTMTSLSPSCSLVLKCPPPPKRYEPSFHSSFQARPPTFTNTLTPEPPPELNFTSTPKSERSRGKSPDSTLPRSATTTSSRTCPGSNVSRSLFTCGSGSGSSVSSKSMHEMDSVKVGEDSPFYSNPEKNRHTVQVECYVTEC